MVDEPENMVLRLLREIRDKQDEQGRDMASMKQEMASMKQEMASMKAIQEAHGRILDGIVRVLGEHGRKLDGLKSVQGEQAVMLNSLLSLASTHDARLLRIERHLGLITA